MMVLGLVATVGAAAIAIAIAFSQMILLHQATAQRDDAIAVMVKQAEAVKVMREAMNEQATVVGEMTSTLRDCAARLRVSYSR